MPEEPIKKSSLRSFSIDKSLIDKLAELGIILGLHNTELTSQYEQYRLADSEEKKLMIIFRTGSVLVKGLDPQELVEQLYPEKSSEITIGCDEAGKGEAIGSIFCCCVAVDSKGQNALRALGVKDSKGIEEKRLLEIAREIPGIALAVEVVKISPGTIASGKKKGLNLDELLRMAYSKGIAKCREKLGAGKEVKIIVDEFSKGKCRDLAREFPNLVSSPHAEEFIPVAAASMLARKSYLEEEEKGNKPWAV